MAWAIKTEVADPFAAHYAFPAQKTMYGGKRIAAGDVVFIFASKNAGGSGLVAKGLVTSAVAIPGRPGVARQTPRVGMAVDRTALGRRPLGRSRLKLFSRWNDGRPETEVSVRPSHLPPQPRSCCDCAFPMREGRSDGRQGEGMAGAAGGVAFG